MNSSQPLTHKLLFVYDQENEEYWRDGLWAAIKLLEKKFQVTWHNIQSKKPFYGNKYDFILGWGGFGSLVDRAITDSSRVHRTPMGLCLGGYGYPPRDDSPYSVVFYETPWSEHWLRDRYNEIRAVLTPRLVHAFGINTEIYNPAESPLIWDYISVGAFANWKRHEKITEKEGSKLVVGQIQKGNIQESLAIIGNLLPAGVTVGDTVTPVTLAKLYRASRICYIPAEVMGGGERSLLESLHCGCEVEIEKDNPKLASLLALNWRELDHYYYAQQLEKGIKECLRSA